MQINAFFEYFLFILFVDVYKCTKKGRLHCWVGKFCPFYSMQWNVSCSNIRIGRRWIEWFTVIIWNIFFVWNSIMWKKVRVFQLILSTIFQKSIQEGVQRACLSPLWPANILKTILFLLSTAVTPAWTTETRIPVLFVFATRMQWFLWKHTAAGAVQTEFSLSALLRLLTAVELIDSSIYKI